MRYLVQIHLSEACNLKCEHCYQENMTPSPILTISDIKTLLEQVRELMKAKGFTKLRVNLTGGEPLLVPKFKDYVHVALAYADEVMVLTNGTLIDGTWADFFKTTGVRVQISLDGTRDIHDKIRGAGSFDKAIQGIKHLTSVGIKVSVACTLHSQNFQDIEGIIDAAEESGAHRIWFNRYVPCGNLTPMTTDQFIIAMTNFVGAQQRKNINVVLNRCLQFLFSDSGVYRCSALTNSIAVLPDKSIMPCRRLPIIIGELGVTDLLEIYTKQSGLLETLMTPPDECKTCGYVNRCNGGLRCLAYATSNLNSKDPNCFL